MGESWGFLLKGMSIDHKQEGFLIRVLWVIAVTGHIFWVCGFLAFAGLTSPFATPGELTSFKSAQEAKLNQVLEKQSVTDALLRKTLTQNKGREIRDKLTLICLAKGPAEKSRLSDEKDRLQREYKELDGADYPEPPCEQLR